MSNSLPHDQFLDASGLECPMPLLKTKMALKALAPAQVLYVLATDAGSWRDIRKYVDLSSHELLDAKVVDDAYQFWIRKGV
ncbi:sulfurtransferase TusA family protein [Thalassolituus sp. LLYu03]|uniref:sulfurtransferase TusA family protein n=1 Tax=Thalassolituus sp. LLYu03 TaxID=3421656 RepID=UPI003D2D326F